MDLGVPGSSPGGGTTPFRHRRAVPDVGSGRLGGASAWLPDGRGGRVEDPDKAIGRQPTAGEPDSATGTGGRGSSAGTSRSWRSIGVLVLMEQSAAAGPSRAVTSAMSAKVGEAAKGSPSTALRADERRAAPSGGRKRDAIMRSRFCSGPAWRPLRRSTPRPISCRVHRLRRSCRASSTTCRSMSADSPRVSPPRPPVGPAA